MRTILAATVSGITRWSRRFVARAIECSHRWNSSFRLS